MNLDTKVTVPETVFLQEIDGETILLNAENGNYFSFNDVGTAIWKLLLETETLKDLHSNMLDVYDVDPIQLEKDILTFVTALYEKNLILLDTND